jgi:NitT/TauT family transport system ATP-binding protein
VSAEIPTLQKTSEIKEIIPKENKGKPALIVKDVVKVFPNGFKAVAKTNLILHKGEFLTIVGPSGCGKSTLLRLIAGLLTPTHGSIETPHLSDKKGKMGFVFQDAHLLPWRTAQGNVELLLEVVGKSKAERAAVSRKTLAKVGLKEFEDCYPRQLSGGMKMRVSLARTLVLKPQFFLMDEPFAAVDEMTRHTLNEDFLKLHEQEKFSTLFVTHSVSEAVFMSNRVVVMSCNPGNIITDIEIPFSFEERTPDLRTKPEFAEVCGVISKHLWEGS